MSGGTELTGETGGHGADGLTELRSGRRCATAMAVVTVTAMVTCMTRRRRWRLRLSCSRLDRVLAGFVGVPHALGGHNQIEAFLEPSFTAIGAHEGAAAAAEAAAPAEAHAETSTELGLMLLSTMVAIAGIFVATLFFLKRPERADRVAAQFAGRAPVAAEQVLRG